MVKKIQVKRFLANMGGSTHLAVRVFVLCACGILGASGVQAESGNYRIEVLVFRHLNNSSAPVEADQLQSYFEFAEAQEFQPPPAPVGLEVQSSHMESIWRKLRLSADFQPLVFAAWEQTRIDYQPPVRIHDEEVIAEQPYVPFLRTLPDADSEEIDKPVVFSELMNLDFLTDPAYPEGGGPDKIYPLPDYTARYYRLDGTVQLTRSRFLHLRVDLEYREALISTPVRLQGDIVVPNLPGSGAVAGATPGPAMVYRLRQSRPVSTGETQYYDSPFLGVVARVTATSGG